MTLNKQKGQMYGFVTHTWNAIKGKCPHDCSYCYMKVFPQGELHFDEKEMKTNLGEGNFIFVGSSCDMFADDVKGEWILKVLDHCRKYPKNTYLFQTKKPKNMKRYIEIFPKNTIFGTTIESNRDYKLSKVSIPDRFHISFFPRRMITLEPLMDFDLDMFVALIRGVNPEWVNIGADSKGHNLPEPSWEKVQELIKELKKFTEIKIKSNLNRLKKENEKM